jgi:hypothetical protein
MYRFIYTLNKLGLAEPIFEKVSLARQLFAKISCIDIHENLTAWWQVSCPRQTNERLCSPHKDGYFVKNA